MDLKVRIAQIGDCEGLADIENKATAQGWNQSQINCSVIGTDDCYVLVDDFSILGYCVFRQVDCELELLNLVIDKHQQGKGYARYLLNSVLKNAPGSTCKCNGNKTIWLEVATDNHVARHLYNKLGFLEVSRRKNYYRRADKYTDALVMKSDGRTLGTSTND